ncbi:MAG: hypothetical protein PHP00_06830 [Thiotrichaceae bacterium]|nr:hypothetical protein [Thiotrichaceae bacterium]
MAALNTYRDTPRLGSEHLMDYPVKAGVVCYQGALVGIQSGFLVPATAATGILIMGRCEQTLDNSTGIDGAIHGAVLTDYAFCWDNSTTAGDIITQANVGALCYAKDDHTVGVQSAGRSAAGRVVKVDNSGVWVISGLEYL